MKTKTSILVALSFVALVAFPVRAQEPVLGVADPEALFKSPDPKLNANKQVAYGIFRDLLEANHWELADKYLTERQARAPKSSDACQGCREVVVDAVEIRVVEPEPIGTGDKECARP
jgi:hypothetical protein